MTQQRRTIHLYLLVYLLSISLIPTLSPSPLFTYLPPWLVITTAQADTENAAGVWTSSLINIRFDDSWMGTFMVEPRVVFDAASPERDGKVRQLLVLGSVGYALSEHITVAQGYANLPSYNPKRIEHRAFQDLIGRHASGGWRIIERIRLEERFLEGVRGVSLRGRFLARAQHPLPFVPSLSGVVSEELFLNFTEPASHGPQSGFDQNRFFLGLNVPLDTDISFEFGYMNLFLEQGGPSPSVSNHLGIISVIGNFAL
jgi:hypothetical protein